MDLHGFS
jgi:hypothetical protein